MKKLKRSSRIPARSNDIERLENRQLLSATLSVNQSLMVFNAIRNSTPSPIETLTLTNTGDADLTLGSGGVSIVSDPTNSFSGTSDAAPFSIQNSASIPATLSPGASFGLQVRYAATAATRNAAILDLQTNDGVNPLQQISLSGIGTTGTGGTNQPSLARILRAYHIPTYVGEHFQDSGEATDSTYPNPPDASSEEQVLQRLVKAGPGPVSIQVLASFTASGVEPYTLGMYTPGTPNNGLQELFHTPTSESQTVFVHPQGATSFDPGTSPFGFYFVTNVQVKGRIGYSEDAFNTWDATNQRKFRFFPLERPDRSIVPNSFVMTSTEWNAPVGYDFTNIVAIVSNVMAAPSAPAAPVLGLQDLNAVPGSGTMLFNRIQNPNPMTGIIDQVHDTGTLRINNTGGSDLVINSVSLSSAAWRLLNPPTFPLTVPAGSSFDLSIQFVATTAPAHPYNETNSPSFPNGGGVYTGSITLNSNDPNTPSRVVPLAGWWQQQSENNDEPSLQSLVNLMNGWSTNITPAAGVPELTESGTTPTYYGEEEPFGPNRQPTLTPAPPTYWTIADTAASISVRQLSSWHTQDNSATLWWFNQNTFATHTLLTTSKDFGQTLFPFANNTTVPAANTFSPAAGAGFGFKVDGEWSDETKNNPSGGGHHIRFYPLRDSTGKLVPNTYLLAMDYAVAGSQNFDFQDNTYIITNIKPATVPSTPNDLYATAGTGTVSLQWAPLPGPVQSYNVYRSLAPSSGFSLLTSGITVPGYTDNTAPSGTNVYYRVSAVNNGVESLASTAAATTSGTPASSLQSTDIAAVPTGSTSIDNTNPNDPIYTVVAGGPGVTGNSDGFRYLFEQQTGDFDVRLQVSSLTVAGSFSTAGLMARASLNANSAEVYMSASPTNYRFKSRTTTGGTTAITAGANTSFPAVWVRLRRVGNVFTGFSSPDGVTWTQLQKVTVSLPSTVFLGLGVASNNTTSTTTAQLTNFGPSFTGPVANADTFNVTANLSTPLDIFANDTDATGTIDRTTVVLSTPNQGGTAVFNPGTNLIDYTPASGFVGTESFTYTVRDSNGLTSPAATVTVIVAPTGPTAHDDQFTTITGQSLQVDVVANDADTTGTIDRTTLAVASGPDHGGTAVVDHTNGIITYTPAAGFVGSETFTYTVGDSNGLTSSATVTMVVTSSPGAPVANPDSASTAAGQSVQINVLGNDVPDLNSGSNLDPASVLTSDTEHGGALQLDTTTGIVTYTPPIGFAGTDTFTYTVSDLSGHTSNSATVTVTVTPNGPVTADDNATAISGSSAVINVLANDASQAGINPGSLALASAPAHGTATPNADGTFTYTPAAGFVGHDSFTYSVGDVNGNTSNVAVVGVDVGVTISSARGAIHVLSWTDPDGTTALLTLNSGSANIFFTNGGSLSTTRAGRGTLSGTNAVTRMTISGTSLASVLVLRGIGGNGLVSVANVSSASALSAIVAPAAALTGTFNIGGLGVLQLANASGARITIGNSGTPAGVVIIGRAIADSSLTSAVPVRLLRVASWTDSSSNSTITAPSIAALISAGEFDADLNLSGSGSAAPTLGVAQVIGAISGDTWTINGRTNAIVAGSIAGAWSGNFSSLLNVFVVRGGGFTSHLTGDSIGTMVVIGDVNGAAVSADVANIIRVTGAMTNSTITLNNAGSATTPSLRAMVVGGAITGSTITTAGDLTALVAGSLANSTITAGVDAGVNTLGEVTSANIGTHAIRALRLTSRSAGAFANSTVIAHTITSATLGDVNTNNAAAPEGLAAMQFTSLTATISGVRVAPTRTQLSDASQLSTYFSDKSVNLGDFRVDIVT